MISNLWTKFKVHSPKN